jgi:peroxiredoxin
MQMKNKINIRIIIVIAGLILEGWALYVLGASPEHWRPAMIVENESTARALYDEMVKTIRKSKSLSYTSICSALDNRISTYDVWLKKPNIFCVEAINDASAKVNTLVGDGRWFWIYWHGIRPFLKVDNAEIRKKTQSEVYIKKPLAAGRNSIRNEIDLLGLTWYGLVLDPSIFHGYTDSLESYIDGVRSRGPYRIGDQDCDIIEVSYMKAQRTRYFWISRENRLPLMMKEILRLSENQVRVEEWSDVTLNGLVPENKLVWSPPDGWQQWDVPGPDYFLLTAGLKAPDFDLLSANGGRIKLSDYRGKVVWLCFWQCGCPCCRKALPYLQKLHERYQDKGLEILGFNCADDKRIAQRYLSKNALTFPNILDSTNPAKKVMIRDYSNKTQTVLLHYIIDPQGKVVDAWCGYEEGHQRALAALTKAGLKIKKE